MTRPLREPMLKEDDGSVISNHLRNHVHLTNCIHLKNHIHRHSPIMAERSIMRNLMVLQRSRSLRDPSTSPNSWHSPPLGVSYARRLEKDNVPYGGRRSIGSDYQKESTRLSASSPGVPSVSRAKVAAAEVNDDGDNYRGIIAAEMMIKEGEPSKNSRKGGHARRTLEKAETRESYMSQMGTKNPTEHLQEQPKPSDDLHGLEEAGNVQASHNDEKGMHEGETTICEEPRTSTHMLLNGSTRGKRRKLKGVRRARCSTDAIDGHMHKNLSVASNSLAQGIMSHGYSLKGEEDHELEVARDPRNGCGIPWNWSRIHHRGKVFLDKAGRSLPCGRSESRMMKDECDMPHSQRDNSDIQAAADLRSGSSDKSDSDALRLLNEPFESHGGNAFSDHDYLGELGIFASQNERDSDLTSEARSFDDRRGSRHGRHRSLAQKYMPKTFRDLVGQNLVAQALSNAILRKKVGLVYVFYGPRGTGKTSCARIFAKALNCQSIEHPKPCGSCTSCISQNMGRNRNVVEVGPVGNFDFDRILDVFENTMLPSSSSHYSIFIIDDCDTLPSDSWNAISKVIDRAPRCVIFLLISSSADHLPHIIISRCQKFFFPKLKDSDIIQRLQFISDKEGLEIDKDALKLIASRSDGSLRDGEMTLDQLSLLGQRISVSLVQELAGLVSDEKLVDLLDMALSADTVNTVKSLRDIMEAGVEPLALMTQLATVITDILAGSYVFTRERLRRKFFRSPKLSKNDMEKLRLALKTLSEAEKQLRMSNDKLTWLTAALLQLAPDHQYLLPNSSADASLKSSPMLLNYVSENNRTKHANIPTNVRDLADVDAADRGRNLKMTYVGAADMGRNPIMTYMDTEQIWKEAIEKIQINALKLFMHQEGKLLSVGFGSAPTVQILFSSNANKSKAEKFRGQILQAFESVLSTAVTLEIRCESPKGTRLEAVSCDLPSSDVGSAQLIKKQDFYSHDQTGDANQNHLRRFPKDGISKGVQTTTSNRANASSLLKTKSGGSRNLHVLQQSRNHEAIGRIHLGDKRVGTSRAEDASCSHNPAKFIPASERKDNEEQPRRQSLVRGKVSLAHVIQQAEGCTQQTGWSRRKAISIAEKLEQENLRLEPNSRSTLCGKAKKITRAKLLHLRVRTKHPHSLLTLVSCGRCSCAKTPPRSKT